MSVVVPTVGRPAMLRSCLESLVRCHPSPREVLVVDQSTSNAVAEVVDCFADRGGRCVRDAGRGRGRAVNLGVRAATQEILMITDDDCTVRGDWIGSGADFISQTPGDIITGRVLPDGDGHNVPSIKVDAEPVDYSSTYAHAVLYGGNMACSRCALLEVGGFDERILPSAEDNDLCYRWLRSGRRLRYEPKMTIWHYDWRTPEELREHYCGYAFGEGMFYAKHLRQGDPKLVASLLGELAAGVLSRARVLWHGESDSSDPTLWIVPAMLKGLRAGWGEFRHS